MLVALQPVRVAVVPLNLTVLVPCAAPKFVPVIVIEVPKAPEFGLKLAIVGAVPTVKFRPLLSWPLAVTSTLPVVAPFGTGTTMLVAFQLAGMAVVPLNVTVLVPCTAPKLAPVIVTDAPAAPDVGLRLVMLGGGTDTMKLTPLLR